MKAKKIQPQKQMTMQEYGMSDEFTRNSIGKQPFFKRDESGQLEQNIDCQVEGADFLKRYNLFLKGKTY